MEQRSSGVCQECDSALDMLIGGMTTYMWFFHTRMQRIAVVTTLCSNDIVLARVTQD
jgi:hypothetical protein